MDGRSICILDRETPHGWLAWLGFLSPSRPLSDQGVSGFEGFIFSSFFYLRAISFYEVHRLIGSPFTIDHEFMITW